MLTEWNHYCSHSPSRTHSPSDSKHNAKEPFSSCDALVVDPQLAALLMHYVNMQLLAAPLVRHMITAHEPCPCMQSPQPPRWHALLATVLTCRACVCTGGPVITKPQLRALVHDTAARLIVAGIKPGDSVSLAFTNTVDYVVAFLAVTQARAVAAPLNAAYKVCATGVCLGGIACGRSYFVGML